MEKIKKKKKKSLSSKLKKMREEYKETDKRNWEQYRHIVKLKKRIELLEAITPRHVYKIEFKMQSNSGNIVTTTEIHEGYTFKDAIENLKSNKTHPNTFELVDLTLLA